MVATDGIIGAPGTFGCNENIIIVYIITPNMNYPLYAGILTYRPISRLLSVVARFNLAKELPIGA